MTISKKKLKAELLESRDLRPDEKGKSVDYWHGYTRAMMRVFKILR